MLLITAYLGVFAQTPKQEYTLSGTVLDSTSRKALDYVSLKLKGKGSPLKVALTGADGSFSFKDLAPGSYMLGLIYLGYQTKVINTTIDKSTNLGQIFLAQSATSLKGVTVTAEKPLIKQEVDRISYNLDADPDSKGSNVLTMMRKIPFLSLDGEENVLFKGKDDFKVLINGRPSAMMERNLKEILRSMPASTIQRIEVITNPSAKYTSEGLAGIINIVTYKPVAGYKGTINVSERFPVGGPGLGSSFTLKKGKLGISAFAGGNTNRSPVTENSNNRFGSNDDNTNLLQYGSKHSDANSGYFGSELSYELNKLNLITMQLNTNGSFTENNSLQRSSLFNQTAMLQDFDITDDRELKGSGWDAGLNFQRGFKSNKNKLLTFSYQYSRYKNDMESFESIVNYLNYPLPNFRQNNLGKFAEQTLQVDYVQLIKKVVLEAGVKGILRHNNSDFTYHTLNAGTYQLDASRSNLFNNDQNIFGIYNSYQFALKKLEFKTGLRIEQTFVDADFISNETNVSKNYFSILPTLSINRKLNPLSAINFGYSQRIKRPGINRLNPFVDRSNPQFERSGNPNLHQSLIHRLQAGFNRTKKTTFNLGIDYSFAKNVFIEVSEYNSATGITRISYENNANGSGLSTNLYINHPVSKALQITLNGNAGLNWLNGLNNDVPVSFNLFTYNVSSSANYNFKKGWKLNGGLNLISKNITSLQGRSNALVTSSFGVNKDLIKNKLAFSASTNNPFTKYRSNEIITTAPNFLQTSFSQDYFRSVNMSLNYSFGKLKDSLKKTKRNIKNDDLSN